MTRVAAELRLPGRDGRLFTYSPGPASTYEPPSRPPRSRVAFAAVHVVADPLADNGPNEPARLDWDATLAYRRHVWSYGLGVAEAMDTAQRGMGLDWPATQELIARSIAESRAVGGLLVCGVGTDQLTPGSARDLSDIERAYEEQCEYVESRGGRVVLMASRELARLASGPDDYVRVYGKVLGGLSSPAAIHWLGEMFDPALAGYWGHRDIDEAMEVCLGIIAANSSKVDGVKVSLLDAVTEVTMRRRLPAGVRMYSGDDFAYPGLIAGDEHGHSDALLGILDAIAPAAATALVALDGGNLERYHAILEPTLPLSRHIFMSPTYYYKTGIVFMAYLNGHQRHFRMVAGLESARSVVHLAELFVLADKAGLLRDPEVGAERMRRCMALAGID